MSHSSQTCFGLLIINKAGGLIYHRNYAGTVGTRELSKPPHR